VAAIADLLSGLSILAAAVYGFALLTRPASGPRTAIKAGAVASIAGVSLVLGGPWLLTAALALSAVGDAFLAGNAERWLPYGLGAFLVAHLLYIGLFAISGPGLSAVLHDPLRLAPCVLAAGAAGVILNFLWPTLGRMRAPVLLYVLVITAMTLMAFSLPWRRSAAMIGAVLFMASDAILAIRLFRAGGPNTTADLAVWWFYWAAQALIARAFLHGT
jgi:uncharacterized membrane protein YhhN